MLVDPQTHFVFSILFYPAMLQKWWKQQGGSPWWRLTPTWLPKLTALWPQPSALFLDPHASVSNNPNGLTYTLTQAYTHSKTYFTPDAQDRYSPCCYLLHYLHPAPSWSLWPHPFLLYLLFVKCEWTISPEEEEVEEWGRWACEVDDVVYKETTTKTRFFSLALALWGLKLCSFPCVRLKILRH